MMTALQRICLARSAYLGSKRSGGLCACSAGPRAGGHSERGLGASLGPLARDRQAGSCGPSSPARGSRGPERRDGAASSPHGEAFAPGLCPRGEGARGGVCVSACPSPRLTPAPRACVPARTPFSLLLVVRGSGAREADLARGLGAQVSSPPGTLISEGL